MIEKKSTKLIVQHDVNEELTSNLELVKLSKSVLSNLKCAKQVRSDMECVVNILIILFFLINYGMANLVHKKFEYKYSFKPPYLAQKDGSVPFWEYGGSKYKFCLGHVCIC